MRSIARRVICFNDEIALHDTAMKQLIDEAAPQLVAEPGIGYVTAAMFYIAWSHPGRCRNEAAFARLGGAAPLPATSGQSQDRHRPNRSGDRQLNNALFTVALSRARSHQPTRDYMDRRRSEGKTDREIRRCLKRTSPVASGASSSTHPAPKSPLDRHRRLTRLHSRNHEMRPPHCEASLCQPPVFEVSACASTGASGVAGGWVVGLVVGSGSD